jgi:hypothetical protein
MRMEGSKSETVGVESVLVSFLEKLTDSLAEGCTAELGSGQLVDGSRTSESVG